MSDDWNCLLCGEPIGMWDKTCRHCGEKQFGENDEYYPDKKSMNLARQLLKAQQVEEKQGFFSRLFRRKHRELAESVFSKEESFVYGIHSDDKMYRKTMELDILSKNYKE